MADLIKYPFPLDDGTMASLDLPRDGLTHQEFVRLSRMLGTLVVQPDGRAMPQERP